MPKLLNTISQLLETPNFLLTADEFGLLDEELREQLEDLGLLIETSPVMSVVCEECESGHVEECTRLVGRDGKSTYRIPCPDAGWVEVPKSRLKQWTLNTLGLTSLFTQAIAPDTSPISLLSGTAWQIGETQIGGATYRVVFAQPNAISTVASMIQPSRTILVIPRKVTKVVDEFAVVMTVTEVFTLADGVLKFQLDRVRSSLGIEQPIEENSFLKRGEYWELKFAGKKVILKDSVGLFYIARLIREPNCEIPALTLFAERTGVAEEALKGSSGEISNAQSRSSYKERCEELVKDIERAKSDNNIGEIESLQAEFEQLASELVASTGLGGRSREKSDAEKIRKSVFEAIKRCRKKIGESHQILAVHLENCISTGTNPRYSPSPPTDWLV